MAEFDVDAFIGRFLVRAEAVKSRGIPPLEGQARREFIAQAEQDYLDFSLVAGASWEVEEGNLILRVPLSGSGA